MNPITMDLLSSAENRDRAKQVERLEWVKLAAAARAGCPTYWQRLMHHFDDLLIAAGVRMRHATTAPVSQIPDPAC